jgi:hypothetical protein
MEMTEIKDCAVKDCAFNAGNQCHALGINIGSMTPKCDTFVPMNGQHGDMESIGGVGACKVTYCINNNKLQCKLSAITIKMHSSEPECMSFQAM